MIDLFKCLFLYFLIFIIMYYSCNSTAIGKESQTRVSFFWALSSSFLFSLHNYFIIGFQESSYNSGDRGNYYADFTWRGSKYFWFDKYYSLLKIFTHNFRLVLAITTFLACFFAFVALSKSKYFNRESIVVFFCSFYFFSSLTNQRQIFADAIAALFFVLLIEYKKRTSLLIYVILIVAACGFHSTAYILIVLFFLLRKNIDERRIGLFVFFIISVVIFLKPCLDFIAYISSSIFPILSNKISQYNESDTNTQENSSSLFIVALKGIPYYFLAFEGFLHRKTGIRKYEHYNHYLLLSLIAAAVSLTTIVSYWYSRFIAFFYIPICIFVPMLLNSIENAKERFLVRLIVIGGMAFFTMRSVILMYLNYGGF